MNSNKLEINNVKHAHIAQNRTTSIIAITKNNNIRYFNRMCTFKYNAVGEIVNKSDNK